MRDLNRNAADLAPGGRVKWLTSNQYYGGLNRRFDRRAALLRRFGFKSYTAPGGLGYYCRTRYGKDQVVASATMMHADRRAWFDTLDRLLGRSYS